MNEFNQAAMAAILEYVSKAEAVAIDEIIGKKREKKIKEARQNFMYLCEVLLRLEQIQNIPSQAAIAATVNKTHATFISTLNHVANMINTKDSQGVRVMDHYLKLLPIITEMRRREAEKIAVLENEISLKITARRSLPLTNQKLWEMAKVITAKQKVAKDEHTDMVDWNDLQDEWFLWLEAELFGV